MSETVQCTGCGAEIPADSFDCPRCGRNRQWAYPSRSRAQGSKPRSAQSCAALAWAAIILGTLSMVAGIVDSTNEHVSGGGGWIIAGIVLLVASIPLFIAASVLTFLARIEGNTRK